MAGLARSIRGFAQSRYSGGRRLKKAVAARGRRPHGRVYTTSSKKKRSRGVRKGGPRRSHRGPRISTGRGSHLINKLEFQNTYSVIDTQDYNVTASGVVGWGTMGIIADVTDLDLIQTECQKPILYSLTTAGGDSLKDTKDKNFKVNSIEVKHQIKNQTNHTQKLTLYAITPTMATDASLEPIGLLSTGLTQQGGGASDHLAPTFEPKDSRMFNAMWKVVQQRSYTFQSGEVKDIQFKLNGFWVNGMQMRQYKNEVHSEIPNRTIVFLAKYQGEISHDTTTKENIALGFCHFDVIVTRKYKYSWKPFEQPRATLVDNQETVAVPEGVYDAQMDLENEQGE